MTCREVGEIVGRASTCAPTVRHFIAQAVEAHSVLMHVNVRRVRVAMALAGILAGRCVRVVVVVDATLSSGAATVFLPLAVRGSSRRAPIPLWRATCASLRRRSLSARRMRQSSSPMSLPADLSGFLRRRSAALFE
jgi:hypothetical protein